MAWIESHQNLEKSHKLFDLQVSLQWTKVEAIGRLHMFWWWCVDHCEDGDLRRFNDAHLAACVELNTCDGKRFVDAMLKAGFIDREPYFRVHDWWLYFGRFLKSKYRQKPEKWQRVKAMYDLDNAKSVSYTLQPNLTKPNQEQETVSYARVREDGENPRKQEKPPESPQDDSDSQPCPDVPPDEKNSPASAALRNSGNSGSDPPAETQNVEIPTDVLAQARAVFGLTPEATLIDWLGRRDWPAPWLREAIPKAEIKGLTGCRAVRYVEAVLREWASTGGPPKDDPPKQKKKHTRNNCKSLQEGLDAYDF